MTQPSRNPRVASIGRTTQIWLTELTNEQGQCRTVRLGQGDSITMQIGETHDIVITSLRPTRAILEWRKLAA